MRKQFFSQLVEVIRSEEERRREHLKSVESEEALDHWIFNEQPLLNELCLMLLVTLNHEVERRLILLAARVANSGQLMSRLDHETSVQELEEMAPSKRWKQIEARLGVSKCARFDEVEVLRKLANSYKHEPWSKPSPDLKEKLGLPSVNYAPMPESDLLREQLAAKISLQEDASYCDLCDRFVDLACEFMKGVKQQTKTRLSEIERSPVPLDPRTFEH